MRGNARRPFRHARRIQKLANSAAIHYSLLPVPCPDDTATVYYNYRHYEPVTGRWLSRDPVGELGFRLVQECLMKEAVLNVSVASSNWDADDWTIHMSANIVLKEVWQRIKNRDSDANVLGQSKPRQRY